MLLVVAVVVKKSSNVCPKMVPRSSHTRSGLDDAPLQTVAFKVYDVDRDGYISNGELFLVLKMMVGNNLKVRPVIASSEKWIFSIFWL